jgi:hypothetical protein
LPVFPALSQEIKESRHENLRSTLLYTDHWAYTYIQLLQDRGYFSELFYSIKPYNRTDVANAVMNLNEEDLSVSEKYWVKILKIEFDTEIRHLTIATGEQETFTKINTEFGFKNYTQYHHLETDAYVNPEVNFITAHLAVAMRGRIDNGLLNDPAYTGRKTDWLAARLEDGYGIFSLGKLNLFAGRTAQNWGPFPDKSLILSGNPYTYDQVGLNFATKHIAFHSTFAKLNSVTYNGQPSDRYFSAHRLDLKFNNGINLGFSETVIYGGLGQSIEFSYLNPFSIFMNAQLNDRKEANENLAFDFFIPLRPFNLSGQILIDDFILDGPDKPAPNRKTSSDRLGFLFGIQGNDLIIKQSQWTILYERIGSYTYNVKQKRPWQSYTYDGRGLGNENNDRDAWELNIKYFPIPKWIFDADLSFTRQGSRNLSSNDFEDSTFVKRPFPSGIVQRNLHFSAGALYQHSNTISLQARVGFDNFSNFEHMAKRNNQFLFYELRLKWILPVYSSTGL